MHISDCLAAHPRNGALRHDRASAVLIASGETAARLGEKFALIYVALAI
jgi:hypothetical protein